MTPYDQLNGQIDLSNTGQQPQQPIQRMAPGESIQIPGSMFTREMQERIMQNAVNGENSGLYPMIFNEVNKQIDQMNTPVQQQQQTQPVQQPNESMHKLQEFLQTPEFAKAYAMVMSGQTQPKIETPTNQPGMTQFNQQPQQSEQQPENADFFSSMFAKNEEQTTGQMQQPGQDIQKQSNDNQAAEVVVSTCMKHGVDPNGFLKFASSLEMDDLVTLYQAYLEQEQASVQQPVQQPNVQQPQQFVQPQQNMIPDVAESPNPQGPIRLQPAPINRTGSNNPLWQ